VALFDLRVLGFARGPGLGALGGFLLPWAWVGFALTLPSGLALFAAQATELVANPAFQLKLLLLVLAGLNAWLFHRTVMPGMSAQPSESSAPPHARLLAAFSLLFWLAVIACGRLIAYL
jgi:hypothetical protein